MPASSDQVRDTLRNRLIGRAGISAQEEVNPHLSDYLDEALEEHDTDYITPSTGAADFTLLPLREYQLVIILAWIRVCEFRASSAAPQPSLRGFGAGAAVGAGFGGDRDTPFNKNMKMVEYLRKQYDQLSAQLEEDEETEIGNGDITVGEFVRRDELLDVAVPLHVAPGLRAPTLSVAASGAGTVTLEWGETLSEYFSQIYVFRATSAGIYQSWNRDGASGVPLIASAAIKAFDTTDNIARGLKIESLAAGTHYFLLAVQDIGGNWTYSNEVSATVT